MRYLPILQELFESDSCIFLLVGFVFGMVMGLQMKRPGRLGAGAVISACLYAACELAVNFGRHYATEIIALLFGTAAMGSFLGFVICLVYHGVLNRAAGR